MPASMRKMRPNPTRGGSIPDIVPSREAPPTILLFQRAVQRRHVVYCGRRCPGGGSGGSNQFTMHDKCCGKLQQPRTAIKPSLWKAPWHAAQILSFPSRASRNSGTSLNSPTVERVRQGVILSMLWCCQLARGRQGSFVS